MEERVCDAVVVGAGFAGIYMLHRLRKQGLSVRLLERGPDVGGTWYWNRYPGLRCDVESMTYSYSFDDDLQKDWTWSERYAPQAEILRYINHVVDRFDLRRDMTFDCEVTSARWDEAARRWTVQCRDGRAMTARYVVMATGCLSVPLQPTLENLDAFEGKHFLTADWPEEGVDFSGKRAAVIGTGSSGIQSIPIIAAEAAHLTVFQRTPNFSIPAHNRKLTPKEISAWKANYPALRERNRRNQDGNVYAPPDASALALSDEERERVFERRWTDGSFSFLNSFTDLVTDPRANAYATDFVHRKIRRIVKDPAIADRLCPTNHPFGTKRLCVDTDYFETFNRANVDLVDISANPIERATARGVIAGGREYPLDIIVFATGFDALTGALNRIDIRGRSGRSLKEEWADGPHSYLGLMIAGFPNLFTVTGPGSPAVFSNMIVSIEQHVEWIADCIAHLGGAGSTEIEAEPRAQTGWQDVVRGEADKTLLMEANSWYVGANVPGKPRMVMCFLGGVGKYREICDKVAEGGYRGFRID